MKFLGINKPYNYVNFYQKYLNINNTKEYLNKLIERLVAWIKILTIYKFNEISIEIPTEFFKELKLNLKKKM